MDTKEVPSLKALRSFAKKMRIRSGDVVLVKSGTPLAVVQALDTFDEAMRLAKITDVIFLVVDDFDDIRAIDEAKMMELGWVRTKRIDKLLGVNHIVEPDDDTGKA